MVARLVSAAAFLLAVTLQAAPARIVSTFPSVTEALFALGAGDRVVGVSTYCRYPPAALALPKIGTYTKPDAEKIALLRPDLVIIERSASGLADRLASLKINYAAVKTGSLAEVYSMILDIGRAIGSPERAEKLNADIRARLDRVRAEAQSRPHPKVLIVVGRAPGMLTDLIAVSPGTYLGELLEIAGGTNIMTGTAIAYPHISLEIVLRLNPDVILDTSNMGDGDPAVQIERLREPWMARSDLSAVRNHKVFGLVSEALVTPGPRLPDAVELLRSKLYQ